MSSHREADRRHREAEPLMAAAEAISPEGGNPLRGWIASSPAESGCSSQ
jgi:hypothetical protein